MLCLNDCAFELPSSVLLGMNKSRYFS